jgi:outer membrane protein assembly factor BamA
MKIASIPCLLIALTLGMECSTARGAETNDVPRVGQLREFDRFTFEGNTSFSGWSLWFGLNSTFDFPELSHPLAPRDAFLAAIESQLRLGYKHCGFPDARITARYDSQKDRVTVQVMEGSRYQCGPVEVVGARKVPVQPIVEALSVTNAPAGALSEPFELLDSAPANRATGTDTDDSTNQSFLWVAGQPAHFDHLSLRLLAGVVTNTLGKHGFLMSQFNLNIVPDARTRTATLQVKILDEGPPATIDRIEVLGNRRDSRKTLLDYLDLKPGMGFTSDLAAAINDRLYHSAR